MSDPTRRFAEDAAAAGLRHAFGVPGSGQSLELIDALEGHGTTFVTTQHEGAAAIMAGTLGRLGDPPGLAVAIKGPGFANLAAGLAACRLEALPVIAAVEAYGPGQPAARAHKRLDHGGFTAAVAKGRRALGSAGPDYRRMADWARCEEPGPVVLELIGDNDRREPPAAWRAVPNRKIATNLENARQPVVIAGSLALREGWSARLNALRVPVFSTATAKGVVDETLPQAAGVYTGVGLELAPEGTILAAADLVVGLGLRAGEVLRAAPFGCPAINVDSIEAAGHEGFGFADTVGPEGVFELLEARDWGLDLVERTRGKMRDRLFAPGFLPAHAFRRIDEILGPDVRLVIDTGYFCTIGEHVWRARRAEHCLSSGSGRFMGMGLPQALAAALADPAVPTVLAVGDGGLGPYLAEAQLAARLDLPLVIVLFSDGGYGSVRTRAIATGLTQQPLLTPDRPWRALFDAMGFATARVDDTDGLAAALGQRGPLFVQADCDPQAYQDMVRDLR